MNNKSNSSFVDNFREWIINLHAGSDNANSPFHSFIRASSLNGNTVRRWRKEDQIPSINSFQKTINEYAKYMGEEGFTEIEVYRDALIEITGLAEYIKELKEESENKDAEIEKFQDANRKLRRRLKTK